MNPIRTFFILTSILISMSACSRKQPCDLLVHNAVVHTIDTENTIVEAIAVRNGEILALGKHHS